VTGILKMYLKDLPVEHELRNTPLHEIKAEYRYLGSKLWRQVRPAYGIAKKTFNQLASCWTDYDEWRCNGTL